LANAPETRMKKPNISSGKELRADIDVFPIVVS
jgi:hypothetical protein